MLHKLQQWGALSDADRVALLSLPHTLRSFESHAYIVRDGDVATHSCLLRSGFAYRHRIVAGGGRQVLAIHMVGDMVDLQNALLVHADHSVQALTQVDVAFIPREAIIELAFVRPAIGQAMWFDTLVDGAIFREWMVNVGRRNARGRLAHLLCEFSVRLDTAGLGERLHYELPMSQEQLADCTGLTPVHVNRTLMALEREGLIDRSRRSVFIENWRKLCEVADFRGDYLHLPVRKADLVGRSIRLAAAANRRPTTLREPNETSFAFARHGPEEERSARHSERGER